MKKKRRSREFKKNSDIIDIEEARERRRRRRERQAARNAEAEEQPVSGTGSHRHRAKRRRIKLVYVIIIIVAAVVVGFSACNLVSLKAQEREVLKQQQQLKDEKAKLEKELERADDPDYVEKEAREQLKLIMPGEKLYFFPQSDDGDSDSNKDKDDD
ncbi:MAG: septum formation initiator family protein [Firmicutes bacterium]|nr:septum formation initiator family protein [Bacillota bacterium]MDO4860856.1 septum formation initiator family protein [Bacillota bacterium]